MGAWLMAMDLRVIDQRRFWTYVPCIVIAYFDHSHLHHVRH